MKIHFDPGHLGHQPKFELVPGKFIPNLEKRERAEAVLDALRQEGFGHMVEAKPAPRAPLLRVHDAAFLDFLESAWEEWEVKFGAESDGLAFVWPGRHLFQIVPRTIEGKLGYYTFDGISPITRGMWRAATGAAGAALAAAADIQAGARASFAVCRPPGHHAGPDLAGGTSYINNTAVAAADLAASGARVAIIDVDAHHGNGTQAIFWSRSDVLTISIHTDPASDYPYFSGYAGEKGAGAGDGFNLNLPLPPGAVWQLYSEALAAAIDRITDFSPDVLVLALGVDAYHEDPAGQLALEIADFATMGRRLADLGLPTAIVLEGGYAETALRKAVLGAVSAFS